MASKKIVTWLGDADPSVQQIEQGGVVFVKGKAEKVPEDHPWMSVFTGNPHFSVDDDAEVEDSGEDAEIAATKAALDAKGVRYRANASLSSLRTLLGENTDTGPVRDVPKPSGSGAVTTQADIKSAQADASSGN